jgi:hypothetical protein
VFFRGAGFHTAIFVTLIRSAWSAPRFPDGRIVVISCRLRCGQREVESGHSVDTPRPTERPAGPRVQRPNPRTERAIITKMIYISGPLALSNVGALGDRRITVRWVHLDDVWAGDRCEVGPQGRWPEPGGIAWLRRPCRSVEGYVPPRGQSHDREVAIVVVCRTSTSGTSSFPPRDLKRSLLNCVAAVSSRDNGSTSR